LFNAKGFDDFTQAGHQIFPNVIYYGKFRNRFTFITFQHNLKLNLNKSRDIGIHLLGGYDLSYPVDNYIDAGFNRNRLSGTYEGGKYPYKEYKDFNKLVLAGELGFGTDIKHLLEINIFHNRDITKFVNREKLIVKNWSFNLQILFNVKSILNLKVE